MSLTVKELINLGEIQLANAGVRDAHIDAKELYCFMMNLDKVGLMMKWQDILQDNQCDEYFELIARRASRLPLQYITGEQEFMGIKFRVNEDVLIPRQDTETMVEYAIELLSKGSLNGNAYRQPFGGNPSVLDLCSGSGAIGISIAKKISKSKVICTDISKNALILAKKNASSAGCNSIKFIESDMFSSSQLNGRFNKKRFDLIISNPPYIESDIIPTLEPEVRDHEPIKALDGGSDGLDFYKIIAEKSPLYLRKNGVLMMEIGYNQRDSVKNLLKETGKFEKIIGLTDLTGKDRVVVATLSSLPKE